MPLFRRSDGTLLRDLHPMRRLMPYVMRGRNQSLVYYEQTLELRKTLPFLETWKQTHGKISIFHLVLFGLARALNERPGLNRFVSGGNIYQRNRTEIAFTAKKTFKDGAALRTLKMPMPADESFAALVARIAEQVHGARSDVQKPVDKEMSLLARLPGFLLRGLMALAFWLDDWNLFPAFMMRDDPMFASLFVTNLGSLGIDRCWHHLYEYGNVSLFCSIGCVQTAVLPGEDGQPELRPILKLMYSFDERINDGHYCVASLNLVKELVEDPERFLGEAAQA